VVNGKNLVDFKFGDMVSQPEWGRS
jgi:hypothetical protein